MPKSFLLSADPGRYDIALCLVPGIVEEWEIKRNFLPGEKQIRAGSTVFFVRNDDGSKDPPRLYGWGKVLNDPIAHPEWMDDEAKAQKKPVTPHGIFVHCMASTDRNGIPKSVVDADEVARGIGSIQGTSKSLSDEEAEALSRILRAADVNAPEDGPDPLARAAMKPATAREAGSERSALFVPSDFEPMMKIVDRKALGIDTDWPASLNSLDVLTVFATMPAGQEILEGILGKRAEAFLQSIPKLPRTVLSGDRISSELAGFTRWFTEICNVTFGGDKASDGAFLTLFAAALVLPREGPGQIATALLERCEVDFPEARRRLFDLSRSDHPLLEAKRWEDSFEVLEKTFRPPQERNLDKSSPPEPDRASKAQA